MKYFTLIFLLSFTYVRSFSQSADMKVDTFITGSKFVSLELFMNSDSSFFFRCTSCLETSILNGRWGRKGDIYFFQRYYIDLVRPVPFITHEFDSVSTSILLTYQIFTIIQQKIIEQNFMIKILNVFYQKLIKKG